MKIKQKTIQQIEESYYSTYCSIIKRVRAKRGEYREILAEHLFSTYGKKAIWKAGCSFSELKEVAFILSASRGGSSATVSLLSQQAFSADEIERIIVVLPGEVKPHLVLSSLHPPFNKRLGDELSLADFSSVDELEGKTRSCVELLEKEILSELGYPLPSTRDFKGFAIRIVGRILLQCPESAEYSLSYLIDLVQKTLTKVTFKQGTPGHYLDLSRYRSSLIYELSSVFSFIELSLFDYETPVIFSGSFIDKEVEHSPFRIEETPFVIPKPWCHLSKSDLNRSVVIFKDPSDCFRVDFWRKIFSASKIKLLHLSRNPEDSIRSLINGWHYPHGFQTRFSKKSFFIKRYSGEDWWKNHFMNFSLSEGLTKRIISSNPLSIEEVVLAQWVEPHVEALELSSVSNYYRIASSRDSSYSGFEFVCRRPEEFVFEICRELSIPATESIQNSARKFLQKPVMRTRFSGAHISQKNINAILKTSELLRVARDLGYSF